MRTRRITIAVRQWCSEEGIHTWKYCKQHVLQPKDGTPWNDQLTLVHVKTTKGEGKLGKTDKDKEREAWESGGPTIPDVATAVQPYNCTIQELEGEPEVAITDFVNKEGMDILVLASRGRGAMKKAMMGSTTEQVMSRAACACLVVKPQVGAGDTYRMKSAASSASGAAAQMPLPPAPRSPAASPIYGGARPSAQQAGGLATPFNRRVAIAYDTTASGRYLLKWASENILEPADNIFVVRAVPRMRRPGTSFADKTSVQRLAGDALSGLPHITSFNMPQGNARKAVLNFVAKESVDLLVIGMYKGTCKRKGLARKGNATTIYNRCGCPVLVVPMSEAALVVAVKAAELEAAAEEEAELASGSETDSSDGEGDEADVEVSQPPHWAAIGAGFQSLAHPRALMGTIGNAFSNSLNFKRRYSGQAELSGAGAAQHSPTAGGDGGRALMAKGALALAGSGLRAGRYVVEVDGAGGIKSIAPAGGEDGGGDAAAAAGAEGEGGAGAPETRPRRSSTGSVDAAVAEQAPGAGSLQLKLLHQQKEIDALKAQLAQLTAGGGGKAANGGDEGASAAGAEAAKGEAVAQAVEAVVGEAAGKVGPGASA